MEVVGFAPRLLEGDSVTTFGDWNAYQQDDSAGLTYGLVGQIVGDNGYVMVVKTDKPGVTVENAAILGALASIKIAGKEEIVIESFSDVEAFVRKEVDRLAGSSLSIAVVHQGEIVYTYAYGQANPAAGIPADTQTIFQFGSMTKVVTASALMYPKTHTKSLAYKISKDNKNDKIDIIPSKLHKDTSINTNNTNIKYIPIPNKNFLELFIIILFRS